MGVGLTAAHAAHAQTSVFYDKPTAAQQTEILSWGQMYMTLVTAGAPAAGASTFAFTAADMNTPLFSPLRAAQATAGSALGSGGCGSNTAPAPGDDVASFLTQGTVSANILSEPDETDALVSTLMSDPEAEGVIEGDELIVGNLTPVQASGTSGSATWASASDATLNWIAGLGELTPGWAASFGQVDDARRRLLGIPRSVDQLEEQVRIWAIGQHLDIKTYQVETRFGAYGALPLIVAVYTNTPESGFLLIDGTNGNMDGPFASHTTIAAGTLMAMHSDAYVAGTSVTIINAETGACAPVAATKHPFTPAPPAGTVPPGLIPAPALPGGLPAGRPSPWVCTTGPGGSCTCISTYNYVPPAGSACPVTGLSPCIIKDTVTCTSGGSWGGGPCNGGAGTGAPTTGTPLPSPGGPVPGTGSPGLGSPGTNWGSCTDDWWYWN